MKKKILIVSSNYYEDISKNLLENCLNTIGDDYEFETLDIGGSFEIPIIILKNIAKFEGFIALGCIIKGETPHFNFISQTITNALMKLSLDYKKPIGNGILTCLNKDQAIVRSKKKGKEAALAVINLLKII